MATITEQTTFEVGDGATFCGWSDRKAGTIIEASAKRVVWQRDKATLLNAIGSGEEDALQFAAGGFAGHTSGQQRYAYERDPDGITRTFTLRKNGRWIQTGAAANSQGFELRAGRSEHYDFNF